MYVMHCEINKKSDKQTSELSYTNAASRVL